MENNNELEKRNKNLRALKTAMVVIDVLAIIILIIQIKLNDVAYYSYVILLITNIITFAVKPKKQ